MPGNGELMSKLKNNSEDYIDKAFLMFLNRFIDVK